MSSSRPEINEPNEEKNELQALIEQLSETLNTSEEPTNPDQTYSLFANPTAMPEEKKPVADIKTFTAEINQITDAAPLQRKFLNAQQQGLFDIKDNTYQVYHSLLKLAIDLGQFQLAKEICDDAYYNTINPISAHMCNMMIWFCGTMRSETGLQGISIYYNHLKKSGIATQESDQLVIDAYQHILEMIEKLNPLTRNDFNLAVKTQEAAVNAFCTQNYSPVNKYDHLKNFYHTVHASVFRIALKSGCVSENDLTAPRNYIAATLKSTINATQNIFPEAASAYHECIIKRSMLKMSPPQTTFHFPTPQISFPTHNQNPSTTPRQEWASGFRNPSQPSYDPRLTAQFNPQQFAHTRPPITPSEGWVSRRPTKNI